MTDSSAVAALFDRASGTYDQVGVEMFGPIADALVGELDPGPGERAVDLGCGRGAALLRLGAATGTTVVGLDLAPGMVEQARTQAVAEGVDADVRLGDVQAPDLPDDSFDVVASSLVLFFLPDPLGALKAWRRLLVPGGRLGVSTFGPFCAMWQAADAVFEPYLPDEARQGRASALSGPFGSDAAMERLFADAGLTDVRTVPVTVSARFDDEEHWRRWSWSAGNRRMWEAVPEEDHDRVAAAAYEVLQDFRGPDGRIGFDQAVRLTLGAR